MARRVGTRLSITVSLLIAATVAIMAGTMTWNTMATLAEHYGPEGLTLVKRNLLHLGLISVLMVVTGILVSYYLGRSFAQPLVQLSDGVRRFAQGDFQHRVYLRSSEEVEGLAMAFNTMAVALQEYLLELEQHTQYRERIESELRIAAEVQRSLLPKAPPKIARLELVAWSRPAKDVGGDFYDFLDLGDGRLGVVIGDATGKGLPAALLTTECWSIWKALAEEVETPAELLRRINRALYRSVGKSGRFITLFYMVVDAPSARIEYSVAGHNPPILLGRHDSRHQLLRSDSGFPLGVAKNGEFVNTQLPLEPEDLVFMFSDGLTDARGPDERRYSYSRMRTQLVEGRGQSLNDILGRIRNDVESHVSGRDLYDDMTAVGVRYIPNAECGVPSAK
ncbi:MAG: SpoIIE family protein phosphatase [Candidatus Hydrogenedentes bacterium]|nr:SpoIIE family protein phosphatase [Candidatus Hydrogenedentota bacterium]